MIEGLFDTGHKLPHPRNIPRFISPQIFLVLRYLLLIYAVEIERQTKRLRRDAVPWRWAEGYIGLLLEPQRRASLVGKLLFEVAGVRKNSRQRFNKRHLRQSILLRTFRRTSGNR